MNHPEVFLLLLLKTFSIVSELFTQAGEHFHKQGMPFTLYEITTTCIITPNKGK